MGKSTMTGGKTIDSLGTETIGRDLTGRKKRIEGGGPDSLERKKRKCLRGKTGD